MHQSWQDDVDLSAAASLEEWADASYDLCMSVNTPDQEAMQLCLGLSCQENSGWR